MTRRLVAAIAAVLAMFAGLAVAAAPFGLAVQRSGHWSRPTVVNVATGGGVALVGLLGFLFATAGLVSHLRRRGLLTPDPPPTTHQPPAPPLAAPASAAPVPAPAPAPPAAPAAMPSPAPDPALTPPPQAQTPRVDETRVEQARAGATQAEATQAEATQAEAERAEAQRAEAARVEAARVEAARVEAARAVPESGAATAGGYVRPGGEGGAGGGGADFPRRPTMQRDGVLGSEWDGFLQPRTASPADLIQGVQAARDPDRDLPPQAARATQSAQPAEPAQPSLASPPPGAARPTGSLAGARPYIVGPYQVGRAPGTGSAGMGAAGTGTAGTGTAGAESAGVESVGTGPVGAGSVERPDNGVAEQGVRGGAGVVEADQDRGVGQAGDQAGQPEGAQGPVVPERAGEEPGEATKEVDGER